MLYPVELRARWVMIFAVCRKAQPSQRLGFIQAAASVCVNACFAHIVDVAMAGLYSCSGWPFVSGRNGNANNPNTNTPHIVTPA